MNLETGICLQNRYEIIKKIGSGGMSNVYCAMDKRLNREVAVKVLKEEFSQDVNFVHKFRLEAQAAAGLRSDANIVSVYDVVDEGDLHFIVMELVEGITLKEYIRQRGRLDIQEGIDIAIQAGRALQTAHAQHIIHRDIKPQNMILTPDGRLKVADFGIARAVSAQTINANNAVGSVHYISPEQARGGRCDMRSDIYSLGITMYEMFTGRVPFDGETSVSIALAHLEQALVPPSVYNSQIPQALERVIIKATHKAPGMRYQSIDALIWDLQGVLNGGSRGGREDYLGDTVVIGKRESQEGSLNGYGYSSGESSSGHSMERITPPVQEASDPALPHPQNPPSKEPADRMERIMNFAGIGIAFVIVAVILLVVARWGGFFRNNSRGHEPSSRAVQSKVAVPDLKDLTEGFAKQKLSQANLELVIVSSEYSEKVERDRVISQIPAAGEMAEPYSQVKVVMSLGKEGPDLSKMGLIGKEKEEARGILLQSGFSVTFQEDYSSTVPHGRVADYSPKNPEKGSMVTVIISKGKAPEKVTMPNIIGYTQEEAERTLESQGLLLGEVATEFSLEIPEGVVVYQGVFPSQQVEKGTKVNIRVSTKEEKPSSSADASESASTTSPAPTISTQSPTTTQSPATTQATTVASYRYVGSIDTNYDIADLIGPSSGLTSVRIMIRLKQTVNGNDVYTTLMEPRTVTGNTILPVRFRTIVGANGVEQGQVEVVDADSATVLKSYTVEFFRVE